MFIHSWKLHLHFSLHIFNCIFHRRFCLCNIANLVPIKGGLNLHGLFIIVYALWNSNDVMAMHDPQAHFGGVNLFSGIFLLGILIWLHNPRWILSFACTTTLRDFSMVMVQAITTLILTIDIEICIFQRVAVQSTRQEISFYRVFFLISVIPVHSRMSCEITPPPLTHTHTHTHIHTLAPSQQQFISQFKRQF